MKQNDFDRLVASVKQAGAIRRGVLPDIELLADDGVSRRQSAPRDPTGPLRRTVRAGGVSSYV